MFCFSRQTKGYNYACVFIVFRCISIEEINANFLWLSLFKVLQLFEGLAEIPQFVCMILLLIRFITVLLKTWKISSKVGCLLKL